MTQEERYGTRDGAYSAWHRRYSIRRFVGIENAQLLGMIDVDTILWVEYKDKERWPTVLIETAQDVGQPYKTATVTQNLAKMAGTSREMISRSIKNFINDGLIKKDGEKLVILDFDSFLEKYI